MKIYGFDIFEGDKGIIIAKSLPEAVERFYSNYAREIVRAPQEYKAGGAYLTDLGEIGEKNIFVNVEW